MNREEAGYLAKVIQAYAEGKTVQLYTGGKWEDILGPDFSLFPKLYRIKPEPKRTVGYRGYYCRDPLGNIYKSYTWENLPNINIEHSENFIKWKHTFLCAAF